MSWALLAAGCPTAIVSRFAVPSASTRDLMIAFHKRFAATSHATGALCDAQRAMLHSERRAHPFNWAAFMLFGRGW
jgi:CHAT domain-containing protein